MRSRERAPAWLGEPDGIKRAPRARPVREIPELADATEYAQQHVDLGICDTRGKSVGYMVSWWSCPSGHMLIVQTTRNGIAYGATNPVGTYTERAARERVLRKRLEGFEKTHGVRLDVEGICQKTR